MKPYGEIHPDYLVPVVNERSARAGAGILLVLALIAFQHSFTTGDLTLTRLAIVGFGIDFFLRVFFGPRFSPSLILGQMFVARQVPEYAGAAQKRFAWALGLGIAVVMGVWMIGFGLVGPVALLGCLICMALLLSESAFGICIGCMVYDRFYPNEAKLCPGGVCVIGPHTTARRMSWQGAATLAAFGAVMIVAAPALVGGANIRMANQSADQADCTVPAFAKAMGHEKMWKQHNGCL